MKPGLVATLALSFSLAITTPTHSGAKGMDTIDLDIGKNINDTAKKSGAPRFAIETHWGATFYEIVDIPPDIGIRYGRAGHTVTVESIFSMTMFADSRNNNDMAVEHIALQFSRNAAKTHNEAREMIDTLIAQFRKGQWKRHIPPTCPAVSGRSAYLDEAGQLEANCPLDPAYRIPADDWLEIMQMPQTYEWLGDGVVARLQIKYDQSGTNVQYDVNLDFQDFTIEQQRNASKKARELAEGDAKGWNSTKKHHSDMAATILKVKSLEARAVERGDHVVPRN